MLRVATHNVNGIRAAERRGFDGWLAGRGCDIVALQEMRCPDDQVPRAMLEGWHVSYAAGELKGRNGVAILTRRPPVAVRAGFGNREFDRQGRYLEIDVDLSDVDLPGLTVASLYLPKGANPLDDPARYARKMRFLRSFGAFLTRTRRAARATGREFLLMGDLNIAHTRLDLKNWRSANRVEGFLPEERAWLGAQLSPRTLVDVVRHLHPGEDGPYSWWRWGPGGPWARDVGWRIDYHLASPRLAARALVGGTDREATYEARMSDHSPVVVDYDVRG